MAASTVMVILVAGLLLIFGGLLAASGGARGPTCSCGERNPTIAKFCRRCGRALNGG